MIAWRRGTLGFSFGLAALFLFLAVAPRLYAQAAGESEKLLAQAKIKQEQAQRFRADANAKLQAAAEDDAQAVTDEQGARMLIARALALSKASKDKEKAFEFRNLANAGFVDANKRWVNARNAELRAAQHKHEAEELAKAAALVKDQPGIAATLEQDAKDQLAQAQQEEQVAATAKAEGAQLTQRAEMHLAQAEKLDPETHRQLAAKPAKVVLREAVHK
jgi:colicin import membrane protein